MKKRIISWILAFCMVLSVITVDSATVQAYGIDYNYVDNVLAEVGYKNFYDDTLTINMGGYGAVGGFGSFTGSGDYPATFHVKIGSPTIITPMTQETYSTNAYNVAWAIAKYDDVTTAEQATAKLVELWGTGLNAKLNLVLKSSTNFYYAASYGNAKKTIAGNNLQIVCINNPAVESVTIKATSVNNIGEYAFAKCSGLKDMNISFNTTTPAFSFPYAFCYGCSSLKYVTYPQNLNYDFGEFAFAKCTSLIHFTGLGKDGATQNWNNILSSTGYKFQKFAFSGCSSITHTDIVTSNVELQDYAFGQSGLSYIGFFDYEYSASAESTYLSDYTAKANALISGGKLSDKAFDGVPADRIYVAHKNIYDALSVYSDGYLFGRRITVANVNITFNTTDSTGGKMTDTIIRYDNDRYTLENKLEKRGYEFSHFTNDNDVMLEDNYNAPHSGMDWVSAFTGGGEDAKENCYRNGTVLRPVWLPKTYKITYVLNGGNADDIDLPSSHTYGVAINELPSPVRYGYDFAGWYEDESFTKEFAGIADTDEAEHTYYAKWDVHVNKITYVLDGGKNNPANPETIDVEDGKVYLKDPTKEGFDFDYWTTGDNDSKVEFIQAAQGDQTLYAVWKVHTNKINYVLNGGQFQGEYMKVHTYGEAVTELPIPVRYGYDFAGWYEDKSFTKEFQGIPATDMKDHTYYAKWDIHVNKITYVLDGGKNNPANPETIDVEDGKMYLKDPTKTGYDFQYWTTGDNDEKVTYIMAAQGDQTLYAVWKVHTYTVSYELGGGEFVKEPVKEHTFGKITYLVVAPKKDKYTFAGWYMDKNFKVRVYDIAPTVAMDVTLYAKWELAVSSLPIPERKGYRFIGWVDKNLKPIANTDALLLHEGNIFANYLDIRWTVAKKNSKTYVSTLKADYEWYRKKEERGDRESFSEYAKDGSFEIYGVADGYVTKHSISINIKGSVSKVELLRDGKKVSIKRNSKSDDIYLKGYSVSKSGVYQLTVYSPTTQKTIKFMVDKTKPVVVAKRTKTVKVKSKLQKKVKKKTVKEKKKGHTVTTITKKGKTKTVKKVTTSTFTVKQKRRMYIFSETVKEKDKHGEDVTTKTTIGASVSWDDVTAGVSTVYINGKKLSAKKVKKGTYTFKKAGSYKVEVYDYIGNHFLHKIVVDKDNADVSLPTCNMKNGATYVTGSILSAKDKSGIAYITITDWHGFKKKYKKATYTFKYAGSYKIHIVDKAGNYKDLKIKVVKKKRY